MEFSVRVFVLVAVFVFVFVFAFAFAFAVLTANACCTLFWQHELEHPGHEPASPEPGSPR